MMWVVSHSIQVVSDDVGCFTFNTVQQAVSDDVVCITFNTGSE